MYKNSWCVGDIISIYIFSWSHANLYKAFIIDMVAPVAPVARYMAEQMEFFEENQFAHILKASTRASNKQYHVLG